MTTASAVRERLHAVERSAEHPLDAPRTLLLHGIGGSARSCEPVAENLAAQGFSSWCLDAPGYGESADPSVSEDLVATVIEFLEAVSPTLPVVLLGTSWGGVVATAVALRRPDRVAGLVLIDSTRGSGTTPEKAAAMLSRIDELVAVGAATVALQRAPRLTAPGADPAIVTKVHDSMAALRLPGFRAAAEYMAATDHGPYLQNISCPTLVLVGEHDVVTGVDESRVLAERIPGALLRILPDAGHVAIQEQPEHVADMVAEFIRTLP